MNCFLPILIFLSTKNILTSRVSPIFLLKKVIILKEMMENLPMKRDYLLTEEGRSPQSRGKYSLKAFRSFLLLTYLLYVSLVLNWFYSRKHTEVKLKACLKLSSHSCFVCLEQQEEETSLKPASTMKCTERVKCSVLWMTSLLSKDWFLEVWRKLCVDEAPKKKRDLQIIADTTGNDWICDIWLIASQSLQFQLALSTTRVKNTGKQTELILNLAQIWNIIQLINHL